MKLSIAPVHYRLQRPLYTAHGQVQLRTGWRVELQADGVTGRGEALPWKDFGTEAPQATEKALCGFEVEKPPHSLQEAREATAGLWETPTARCAVECALLEYMALRQGVPVACLFAKPRRRIHVNALLQGDSEKALVQAARDAVAKGYPVVKVKVATKTVHEETRRLTALRQALGARVGLRLDANGGWSERQALQALKAFAPLRPEVCEQPVAAGDIEALRRLRQRACCPIAADESLLLPKALEGLLAKQPAAAVDVLVLKPSSLGGLITAMDIAQAAYAAGVATYTTTLLDGPLSRAAVAHLAAVAPTTTAWAHGLATVELFDALPQDAFTPVRGSIVLPDTPGWGLPEAPAAH